MVGELLGCGCRLWWDPWISWAPSQALCPLGVGRSRVLDHLWHQHSFLSGWEEGARMKSVSTPTPCHPSATPPHLFTAEVRAVCRRHTTHTRAHTSHMKPSTPFTAIAEKVEQRKCGPTE